MTRRSTGSALVLKVQNRLKVSRRLQGTLSVSARRELARAIHVHTGVVTAARKLTLDGIAYRAHQNLIRYLETQHKNRI
jgi:hypothetical protein